MPDKEKYISKIKTFKEFQKQKASKSQEKSKDKGLER